METSAQLACMVLLVACCLAAAAGDDPAGGYLGCYKDDAQTTMTEVGRGMYMTIEKCRGKVLEAGYTVFAVQSASICFGSRSVADATRLGPADNCSTPCEGAAYQDCGGVWAHTTYNTTAGEAYFYKNLPRYACCVTAHRSHVAQIVCPSSLRPCTIPWYRIVCQSACCCLASKSGSKG